MSRRLQQLHAALTGLDCDVQSIKADGEGKTDVFNKKDNSVRFCYAFVMLATIGDVCSLRSDLKNDRVLDS
jgi:hypothetical protein